MKHWHRRGAVAWLLWPLSLVFRCVVFVRRVLFRIRLLKSEHPGIPVIVVGNLVAGGSGKTPLVLWIAEFLKSQGWSPAIVSRGSWPPRVDANCALTIEAGPAILTNASRI